MLVCPYLCGALDFYEVLETCKLGLGLRLKAQSVTKLSQTPPTSGEKRRIITFALYAESADSV